MPRRPQNWEPLHDGDPVPGDPEDVAELGRKLRKMAEAIDDQSRNIKALSSVEGWDSDAGRKFHEIADGTAGRLRKAYDRYDEASKALGTTADPDPSNAYASELSRAQKMADKALEDFRTAESEHKAASRGLEPFQDKEGPLKEKERTERGQLVSKQQNATQAMYDAREKLREAMEIRDDAGRKASRHIKNIVHHDEVKDPGGFMDWIADHADVFSAIGATLAVAALVAAVVLTGGALAGALVVLAAVASATALAGHSYDMFARGAKFDALKLGMDVLGIIPGFGALKGLTAAAKGARFAAAGKGAWGMFTNGMATKGVNLGAKLINKLGVARIPAAGFHPEIITRYIKGAGFAGAAYKMGDRWDVPEKVGDAVEDVKNKDWPDPRNLPRDIIRSVTPNVPAAGPFISAL
ncbi:putative T7SS-secreted protein [Streptomyces boninensis]|uniref:putative T7SS-secreted protein n=1 Tax=Streptomyces boninensis TaxID=2039455 RepID=UPI003B21C6B0